MGRGAARSAAKRSKPSAESHAPVADNREISTGIRRSSSSAEPDAVENSRRLLELIEQRRASLDVLAGIMAFPRGGDYVMPNDGTAIFLWLIAWFSTIPAMESWGLPCVQYVPSAR